jgi:hypothetical protein
MHARQSSHRIFASVALAAMLAVLPLTSSVAQAQGVVNRGFSVPISGTATAADGTVQAITGTFTIQRFAKSQRQIYAVGTVVGSVASATPGTAARTFVTQVSLPLVMPSDNATASAAVPNAASALATCDILNLHTGTGSISTPGARVHLNQVILDIVGATGAGNLLGNLLCAVTGLLDGGGGPLGQIVTLLNSISGYPRLTAPDRSCE